MCARNESFLAGSLSLIYQALIVVRKLFIKSGDTQTFPKHTNLACKSRHTNTDILSHLLCRLDF